MHDDEVVMLSYCVLTFGSSAVLFALRGLLLRDAGRSRLSKAKDYVRPVEIVAWVLLWYGVSVSIVMANRWLFHYSQKKGIQMAVLVTTVHMWIKVLLSRIAFRSKCPCAFQGPKPSQLGVSVHIKFLIPIGIVTAADILFSNTGLIFSTVSFYTIAKSGALIWIFLWACVFRMEKLSLNISVAVTLMCSGLVLASWRQTDFSMIGLIMIMSASCSSGLRWVLLQVLQSVDAGFSDPMVAIYYIALPSALSMVPFAILVTLWPHEETAHLTSSAISYLVLLIIGTGLFSFMLIYAEVKLLSLTSSVTMGVFGTVKEIIQIVLAVLVFHDPITLFKVLGLILAVLGSMVYKTHKGNGSNEAAGTGMKLSGKSGGRLNESEGSKGTESLLLYSAVSQQEVDEELRVFKYANAELDLEGELEEFSSFTGL